MKDSYHDTGTAGTVEPFAFWAFILSSGRALLYVTVRLVYHIIKLFRFLQEVEIFFKPLRKGWNVVHTFSDRFVNRYDAAMWLSITETRSCVDWFFVATPIIMRLINKDIWRHLACMTRFDRWRIFPWYSLQDTDICEYFFMSSHLWPIMQINAYKIFFQGGHYMKVKKTLLGTVFHWMISSNKQQKVAFSFSR